jgi:tagatose 1,6-diphosphate aldolase
MASALEVVRSQELRDSDLVLGLKEYAVHPVHKVPAYYFLMVHAHSRERLGSINLRVASTPHVELYAGHIGYGVHSEHRGHRYAARSLTLLVPMARRLGLDPMWITCDPDNAASRRTLEIAGAQFVEVVEVPTNCIIYRNGHPAKCRFRLQVLGSGIGTSSPTHAY